MGKKPHCPLGGLWCHHCVTCAHGEETILHTISHSSLKDHAYEDKFRGSIALLTMCQQPYKTLSLISMLQHIHSQYWNFGITLLLVGGYTIAVLFIPSFVGSFLAIMTFFAFNLATPKSYLN